MIKKLAIALSAFLLFSLATVQSAGLISSHRLAVIGGTRPTLVATAGSYSGDATTTRTVSITPPVGTSLLVAYVGATRTGAHSSFDYSSLTFNGVAMTHVTNFNTFGDRVVSGLAYVMNPTTGVSQNLIFNVVSGVAWNGNMIYIWAFSGTDPSDPIGQIGRNELLNATTISETFAPEYNRPYIVGGSVAAKNAGGGDCYIGTNLTIAAQGRDDSDDVFGAAAANSTLTAAGPTTFTMNCTSSGTGHITLDLVEIKGP